MVTPLEPPKTSAKAILSLVFGLFVFFFPFSIVAVILGHLSLSEIKKSAGRLTGDGLATVGLVLGYIGSASIPVILILAAIAIPNLLRARMAANESAAVASLRTIVTAEASYQDMHQDQGYACSLSDLQKAGLISRQLASGQRSGYKFDITVCSAESSGGANTKFQAIAYPITPNQNGTRAFCVDESGVIKQDGDGSASACMEKGAVLQ